MRRGAHTATYNSWQAMKNRCRNPNQDRNNRYHAIGITYPAEWESYGGFLADMGEAPKGKTIDRINGTLSYSKTNCRWATRQEQADNKCNKVLLTLAGQTHTIKEWSKILGVKYNTIHRRINRGIAMEDWENYAKKNTPVP